jgi:membrane associated rhomboid family serine protease
VIPLRDDVPSHTVPVVNYVLIALNVFAFFLELGMGAELQRFFYQAAVVPVLYTGADRALDVPELFTGTLNPELGLRLLFSMFLHGGWLHIIGNMLYLWIFGDNVEDRLGHLKYLVFYLLCGWIASFAHIWASPASRVPSIGASGAIAGVLGAYLVLFPHARVHALLPLGIFTQMVHIPAVFFLGFWFLQQFLLGAADLNVRTAETGGVAWWAHIGGFLAGVALVWVFRGKPRRRAEKDLWWRDERYQRRVRRPGW